MIWLAAFTAMLCAALLAWRAYAWFRPALGRYRQVYTQETGIKLTEVFFVHRPGAIMAGSYRLLRICGGFYLCCHG